RLEPYFRPPETPCEPMEFLCRSWSLSSRDISKPIPPRTDSTNHDNGAVAEISGDSDESVGNNAFPLGSSEASLVVMERIMSQSDVSPRYSGRLSHNSSGPLNGGGHSCGSLTDSPPVSPSEIDAHKFLRPGNIPAIGHHQHKFSGSGAVNGGGKTVGRWLKDRREKKKEELRAHNAQTHAAISVAGLASAVAAIAAATAASSGGRNDERTAKTDMAVASAATLVAAQCVDAAEALGAEREHLASVVSSAVNARSAGDIMTLTAAAATALRAAATLKARTLRDALSFTAAAEKGICNGGEILAAEDPISCNLDLLARGGELLKRTRKGHLHWKIVSVYINKSGQVTLKTTSKHVAGTVTKKKKS
ncbi:hypothetical protein M569_09381, partial [Genlisea aurea]